MYHQVCNVIESLRPVPRQEGLPPPSCSKTLLYPLKTMVSVARLQEQEQSPEQVLDLHYRRDLETLPCTSDRVRGELVVEAYDRLLTSHPVYHGLNRAVVMASLQDSMDYLVIRGLVSEEDPPAMGRVFSIFMPDTPHLSPHQRQILKLDSLDTKLAALFDPSGEARLEQDREVPINLQQWCQQRLQHVRRDGPMDRPGLVLSLALQHCTERIDTVVGEAGLQNRPGTSSFHGGTRARMVSQCRWQGPPTFAISISFNPKSEVMVSNWVAHSAGVAGRQEKVWHRASEQQWLTPRPGREQDVTQLQGSMFVHCETQQLEDSCPFHAYCDRRSLEDWRER